MKVPSPFWAMLKSELALGRSAQGVVVVIITAGWWFCAGAFPLVPLYAEGAGRGCFMTYFEAGFVPIVAFQLLGAMSVWMAFATIPALSHILPASGAVPAEIPDLGAHEFMFTRAVNRRIFFRAKTTAFCILAMTPFLVNLLASPLAPDVRVSQKLGSQADTVGPTEARRFEEYREVFHTNDPRQPIYFSAVFFCAWMTWAATLCAVLMQGYGVLIARYVKPNNAWTGLYALIPLLLLIRLTIFSMASPSMKELNVFEKNFLFFTNHIWLMVAGLVVLTVALQAWCERRFSKLEIL